jgi:hypothetical protein
MEGHEAAAQQLLQLWRAASPSHASYSGCPEQWGNRDGEHQQPAIAHDSQPGARNGWAARPGDHTVERAALGEAGALLWATRVPSSRMT